MTPARTRKIDVPLLAAILILVTGGLIMVYSSSAFWAEQHHGSTWYFLSKQAIWCFLGLVSMTVLSRLDYNQWKAWAWPVALIMLSALVVVFMLAPVAGVRRWIRAGPLRFQPAEFAKYASIIFLSYYLDRKRSKLDSFTAGLLVPLTVLALLLSLIALEPDLGTPVLMFIVALFLIFVAGGKMRHLAAIAACAMPLAGFEALRYPYRRQRLLNFLNPSDDPLGHGYQVAQSLLAVGSGGWFGEGFGASRLKLMYLPTPHTDFIFPIICEELGLAGALGCVGLFTFVLIRGMRIARAAPNLFGTLLASGITLTISLQAFINIAMSIGLLPTKGMTLPLLSFGGSSLLATLAGLGVLLNISKQVRER